MKNKELLLQLIFLFAYVAGIVCYFLFVFIGVDFIPAFFELNPFNLPDNRYPVSM